MFRANESTGYIYIDEGYIRGLLQKQNVTMKEASEMLGHANNYLSIAFGKSRMNEETAHKLCDLLDGDWNSFRGIYGRKDSVFEEARALYEEPEEDPVVIAEQTPVVLVKREEEDDIEKLKKYLCDLYLAGTKMVNVLELMEKLQ